MNDHTLTGKITINKKYTNNLQYAVSNKQIPVQGMIFKQPDNSTLEVIYENNLYGTLTISISKYLVNAVKLDTII